MPAGDACAEPTLVSCEGTFAFTDPEQLVGNASLAVAVNPGPGNNNELPASVLALLDGVEVPRGRASGVILGAHVS